MENNNLTEQPTIEDKDEDKPKTTNKKRPVSYYENNTPENGDISSSSSNTNKECKFDNSPTQMHCLTTTVPQNIASENLAGKHTPTRNSLRHSRMIVLNRSGKAPAKYVPPIIRYHKFVKSLLILITFLGTVLCTLSLLMLLWSPHTRSRDNPYWSAIPVVVSGIIGYIFIYIFPIGHRGSNLDYWISSIKYASIAVSLIAAIASFIISGFAVIHLLALATLTCSPPDKVNTTCLCQTNSTDNSSFLTNYHYVDLNCTEVYLLHIIITFTCVTNVLAGISEIVYLYLHWFCKISIYSRVQTKDSAVILNKTDR